MSRNSNADGLLMKYYAEDTHAEKMEMLCGWISQLNNGLMALDRSYMAHGIPSADLWPEICGAFHMVQTFGEWLYQRADELQEEIAKDELQEQRRALNVEAVQL